MADGQPLAVARLEPGLSRSARLEAWHELTRPLFRVATLTPPGAFDAAWALYRLDQLIVSQVRFTAQEFVHDPGQSAWDNDHLLLELYEGGHGRGMSAGTPTFIDSDCVHLVDLSRSYRTVTTSVDAVGVVIPHSLVQYDPRRHPSYLSMPAETPRGAILRSVLRGLIGQLPSVTTADAPDLANAVVGLVRSLLLCPSASLPKSEARALLSARIRAFIDQNLTDQELGSARLCRQFNISRATLYRLFQDVGGIDAFIRDRRLDRCSADLMDAGLGRGRVREVAERLGFMDPSQFNRAFRRRFGTAPSDHLGGREAFSLPTGGSAGPAYDHEGRRLLGIWLSRSSAATSGQL
jgi:AraC-like DNA-binding protein